MPHDKLKKKFLRQGFANFSQSSLKNTEKYSLQNCFFQLGNKIFKLLGSLWDQTQHHFLQIYFFIIMRANGQNFELKKENDINTEGSFLDLGIKNRDNRFSINSMTKELTFLFPLLEYLTYAAIFFLRSFALHLKKKFWE